MKKYLSILSVVFLMMTGCAPSEETPQPEPPTPDIPETPVIIIEEEQIQIPAAGGDFSFTYTIENPSDADELSVSCSADWIISLTAGDGTVSFSASPYEDTEGSRTAEIVLSYPGAEDVSVSAVQSPAELPACPVEMYIVRESYYYARITWLPEDDNITYISFIMDKETFDSYGSEEALFADDVKFYQDRADALGISLEEYVNMYEVFYHGGMTEEITGRTPGTDYVVYTYSAILQDGALVRTSAVGTKEFRTKELVIHEADFNIDADMRSNRMTLKVSSGTTDFRFGMTLFTEDEFSAFTDAEAAAEDLIWQLEVLIYMNGLSWENVTYLSENSQDYDELIAGDKYYAVACGIDDAVLVSNVAVKEFEIPMPEITDNCTFSADFINVSAIEMDVTVNPSNETTRYMAVIKESSFFTSANTPEIYVADLIYNLTYFDAVDWSSTSLLHTGEHTFNTHTDVAEPEYLKADTEYTLLVFGVDEYGERTTNIAQFVQRTSSAQTIDLEIDIEITSVEEKAINAVFMPSIEDANYHFDAYPFSDYEGKTPEEFMEHVISINGEYLRLYQGEQSYSFTYYFPRPEYLVFAFGYDGQITSDLYMKRVNMSTGEVSDVDVIPQETARKILAKYNL